MRTPSALGVSVVLTALALFASAAALAGTPAKPETPFEKARRLAASKEKKDRVQALRWLRALGKPGANQGEEAQARYGDLSLRFHKEGARGMLAEAKRTFTQLEKKGRTRWGLRGKLGLYRIQAIKGKREEAIKAIDRYMATHGKDDSNAEAGYYLGCLAATYKDDLKKMRLAAKALDYALKLVRSRGKYYTGLVSGKQIGDKLNWVRRRIREIETGEPKLTFQKAESARRTKRYKQAIGLYTKVWKKYPEHVLSHPAGYYVGLCHFLAKDQKAAEKLWREFIKQDSIDPWRAQARLSMGDMILEHQFLYTKARGVFDALLADLPKASHPTWKEAAASIYERVGLCEYVKGRFKQASAMFGKASEARPKNPQRAAAGWPDAGQWLVQACNRNDFPSPRAMLGQGGKRARLAVFLADAYYLAERFKKASGIFYRVHAESKLGGTLEQRAYARRRQGLCYYQLFEWGKALHIFADFESTYSKTNEARMGLIHKGVVLCGQGNDKALFPVLRKVIKRWPASQEAAKCQMVIVSRLIKTQRYQEAFVEANRFLQRYPNHVDAGWVRIDQMAKIRRGLLTKARGAK